MVAPRELRNHYGDLLTRAEQGERIDIERDGRVVATLGPPQRPPGTPRQRVLDIFAHAEPVHAARFFDDLYGEDGAFDDTLVDPLHSS